MKYRTDISSIIDDFFSSTMDQDNIERLWKSRKTILQILEDRGYPIDKSLHLDLDEFVDWVGDDDEKDVKKAMTLELEKNHLKTTKKILVIWWHEPKLGTDIKNIYTEMQEKEVKDAIVIVEDAATPHCTATIRSLKNTGYYIDVYTLQETLINVTKHCLVPKHEICTPQQKKVLFIKYSLNEEKIPWIRSTDPQIRHLGATKKQLIRITRESETQPGNYYISYRLVM